MKYITLFTLVVAVFTSSTAFAFNANFNKDEVKLLVGVNTLNKFEIQMEAPSELLLGINHKPTSPEELNKWQKLQTLWFKNYKTLFSINDDIQCIPSDMSLEIEVDSEISKGAILGEIVFECDLEVPARSLQIKLKEKFKSIQKIELTQMPLVGSDSKVYLSKNIEEIRLK